MRRLGLAQPGERLSLLCLGAHSDDIEIGAGATILDLIQRGIHLEVHWVVLSAVGQRGQEARASAAAFLEGAARSTIDLAEFKDGYFPYHGGELKTWLEQLKARTSPDVVLTHLWRDNLGETGGGDQNGMRRPVARSRSSRFVPQASRF